VDRIGKVLAREGLITVDQLEAVDRLKKANGISTRDAIIALGFLDAHALLAFVSKQFGVPTVDLREFEVAPDVLRTVPREVCEKHDIVPINLAGATLIIAMEDPTNIFAIDEVKFLTGYHIEIVITTQDDLRAAIARFYGERDVPRAFSPDNEGDRASIVNDTDDNEPVHQLLRLMMSDATLLVVDEVLIERRATSAVVSFARQGKFEEVMFPPLMFADRLTRLIAARVDDGERGLITTITARERIRVDWDIHRYKTRFGWQIALKRFDGTPRPHRPFTSLAALTSELAHASFVSVVRIDPEGAVFIRRRDDNAWIPTHTFDPSKENDLAETLGRNAKLKIVRETCADGERLFVTRAR
jgi:type IV pilus assembly protein PilB